MNTNNSDARELLLQNAETPSGTTPAQDEQIYTFDEAISLTKVGIFHYFLQIVCGITLMTSVVEIMGVSIVMPFIRRDIPSTAAEKGLLASAGFLGIVLSSNAVGFLSDTCGRAKMLRTTLSLSFITSVASAFSFNIWMLIVLRFLTGFILSAFQGNVYNYVAEFHSSKTRAKYVAMLSVFIQLGMIVMPALALIILPLKLDITVLGLQFKSWRLLMLVFSFTKIFALIGLFVLPESPRYILAQDDLKEALKTLRMIYSKNTKNPRYTYPVDRIAAGVMGDNLKNAYGIKGAIELYWKQTVSLFSKNRISQTLNICIMMVFINGISNGAFMWFPTILKEQMANSGSGLTTCQIMQSVLNNSVNDSQIIKEISPEVLVDTAMLKVLIVIGSYFSLIYLLFSLIINAVGKRRLLFILILVAGLSSLVLQFITSIPLAIAVFTFIMALANCTSIIASIAFDFFPTKISGMAMNLVMMSARIGSATGSNLFGSMMYDNNCDMLFYVSFVLCLIMLVLSILLPSAERGHDGN